jgi:hypothetical protein
LFASVATAQSVYTPYQIATYAGTATYGSIDGSAQAARFASPMAVAVDAAETSTSPITTIPRSEKSHRPGP